MLFFFCDMFFAFDSGNPFLILVLLRTVVVTCDCCTRCGCRIDDESTAMTVRLRRSKIGEVQ
ncbi:hypothetical protein RYX36_010750 [Vicia faba]